MQAHLGEEESSQSHETGPMGGVVHHTSGSDQGKGKLIIMQDCMKSPHTNMKHCMQPASLGFLIIQKPPKQCQLQ